MKRLLDALGADYVQWRALSRAYALIDFAALLGAYGPVERNRARRHLVLLCVFLALIGAGPAFLIWIARDTLVAATVMTTTVGWLAATIVLLEIPLLVAPDDYEIVGFHPVDSTTYLTARTTGLLSHAAGAAVLAGWPSVVAFLARPGGSWQAALAAALAIAASVVAVTFAIVACHGWLVRVVRPRQLAHAVLCAQGFIVVVAIGVFLFAWMKAWARIENATSLGHLFGGQFGPARQPWMFWYPGTWFASYVEVARGSAGGRELAAACASVATLAILGAMLFGRLSADYSLRVAEIGGAAEKDRVQQNATRVPTIVPAMTARTLAMVTTAKPRSTRSCGTEKGSLGSARVADRIWNSCPRGGRTVPARRNRVHPRSADTRPRAHGLAEARLPR